MTAHDRALLDTAVVIDLDLLDQDSLPARALISALTLMELAQGPYSTADPQERAKRQDRLQWVEGSFDALSFDVSAARAYGRVSAAVRAMGRRGGGRVVDLQIAAVALANSLPLYTRNPDDFRGLEDLLTVVAV